MSAVAAPHWLALLLPGILDVPDRDLGSQTACPGLCFLWFFRVPADKYLKSGHDCFLPYPHYFVIR